MKSICNINECTGCYACFNICRQNAIQFTKDELGFFRPTIDNSKCIDCTLCYNICPVNKKQELKYPLDCYAVTLKDKNDILKSASGGAATALTRNIIRTGGIAYGASDEDIFNVKHIRISKEEDIEKLRGSKYVQSSINDIYSLCKSDLQKGLKVLFIGTPCQVAGLKSFLRKDFENLYTIDLVCHGVPSQQMLNENIEYYQYTRNNTNDLKIVFRKKNESRKKIEYGFYIYEKKKSIEKCFYDDSYMLGFLSCLTFRDSCYNCRYATSARVSDITLADFWGLNNNIKFERYKGVSACLLNTNKGLSLFEEIKDQIIFYRTNVVEAIIGNGRLQCPSKRHKNHYLFRELYPKELTLENAISKCLKREKYTNKYIKPLKERIKKIIKLDVFKL